MAIADGIEVFRPWRVMDDSSESPNRADRLSARFQSEIPEEHLLHGLRLRAVAIRIDRDDVLFEIAGGNMPLAVVHMTWRKETNPDWPARSFSRVGRIGCSTRCSLPTSALSEMAHNTH